MQAHRLIAVILALAAAACANPRATLTRAITSDPAKPYLGKTKTEIIACAGTPWGAIQRPDSEILTYHYSGAGPVPGAAGADKDKKSGGLFGGGKKKDDKDYKCVASMVFENGRLTRVTFAPKDAVSPYATKKNKETGENEPVPQPEPCVFSLPNCTRAEQ
jgi:hypothetical protein